LPPSDFDRELEELRDQYREKLARELDALESLLRESESASHDASRLEAIRDRAHRLMGTSGSYGLAASSAALGRMELRVADLLAAPAAEVGAAWPDLESDLTAARAGLCS